MASINDSASYGDKLAKKSWLIKTGKIPKIIEKHKIAELGRMIDIGCGAGSTALFFKNFFKEVYAADQDCYLSDESNVQLKFLKMDLNFEKFSYPDGYFDLVTALQVIEHLENPFQIMYEAHRTLRPGGFFIISIPNPFQITSRLKFLFGGNIGRYTPDNNHLLFLTRDVFKKTYLAKFDLVETIYQKGDIPLWGRLGVIFGKKRIGKHQKILPPSELFSRGAAYVLRKK